MTPNVNTLSLDRLTLTFKKTYNHKAKSNERHDKPINGKDKFPFSFKKNYLFYIFFLKSMHLLVKCLLVY